MPKNIYKKLREQLDQYSTGFPESKSGIEYNILERLYTEEQASMYLDLTLMLEDSKSIAERTGRDPEETEKILNGMFEGGLVFRLKKNEKIRYGAVPFVIGSYEFQLNNMDLELAKMFEQYFSEVMLDNISDNVPPLRTIPVNKSIDVNHQVAPYADAKKIIDSKDVIAVADCICRKQQGLLEKGCGKPLEVCLIFGSHAKYYVDKKMARLIDKEEAKSILDKCEEAGLVNQPASMVNPGGMCNCCGDCCGVLRGLNMQPKPSEMVCNNYLAIIETDECIGCEICVDRCQMNAIYMNDDGQAEIDQDHCIGCGLCVTTCSSDAISMSLKPEYLHKMPPADGRELMEITAKKRGKSLMPLKMLEANQ